MNDTVESVTETNCATIVPALAKSRFDPAMVKVAVEADERSIVVGDTVVPTGVADVAALTEQVPHEVPLTATAKFDPETAPRAQVIVVVVAVNTWHDELPT